MAKSVKSVSIGKAQVPVSCHFCNGLGTKWKCEECDVFMCSSCKEKVHGKLKSSQSHEVVSIHDIQDTFASTGSIEVVSEVVTSVFNSFTTSLPTVRRLLCSNDDIVYILDNKSAECSFIKGKLLKASIRILETHSLPMFDFTMNKQNEILFTNLSHEEESPVRMLSSSGEIRTVLDPKPMRILALHVNRDNELICGLREQGPPFPVHDFSVRQIVIFDGDFRRKITLENDNKGRTLFSYPICIRTNSKNVIYTIDMENTDCDGKLLAVDRTGHLKFSYRGSFSSFDVTSINIIILLDQPQRTLHVLNSKGILIALQSLKKLSIENPRSICIDNEGFLLIGCKGKVNEYGKIHVVKIAEHFM